MQWQIRNGTEISVNLEIDDIFLLWFTNKAEKAAIKNFLVFQDTKLHEDTQKIWLNELHNTMEFSRSDAKKHCLKGNKLPQDPQLREQVLSDLADRHVDKHNPNWSLMKDLEALLELAISTESIIHCVSN